ncbi:MAG: substrate-binding domain-containing protein [Planctomycetia bacterium]|nr:substrate-binding domain-containing protein [Planctomycetia bacterium]
MKFSPPSPAHLLVALLSLGLAGCAPPDDILRIVVIPKGLTHEFWQSIQRGAEQAAADLTAQGTPTRIIWDGPLRERDALAQIRIVDRHVSTQVAGIVLAPQHSQTLTAPVQRAVEQGVPVVIIDSGIARPELALKYVATDNYQGGRLSARHLLRVLREKDGKAVPRLVLFRYQVGSESTERREQGFEDEVNDFIREHQLDPQAVWLSKDQYASATKDSAMKAAAPLVNRLRDRIDGIFAPNESSASGMLETLRSLGLNGQVRLMGFDTSDPLLQGIEAGDLDGVIAQDPYRMGYLGVWTLARYLKGDDVNAGGTQRNLGTGEYVITRDNLHQPEIQALIRPELQRARQLEPPVFPRKTATP